MLSLMDSSKRYLDRTGITSHRDHIGVTRSVAVSRAQVQQELLTGTIEGTDINITCSHTNIQSNYIQ
ncbi:hypothetical protein ASZ78_016606 [Callipepla squamata]|uniref:Uncharacterized protein n=1 Tax=Callipepla squamata TaxID=9009 RepID=A0A226MFS8_CALSU|nr:hypothetical protein ASZ78_016606 [Callipepla squamata]